MPDGISNVDPTILKLAKQYHDCNVRSGLINDERALIRENCEKLGIDPASLVTGVRMVKVLTKGQRSDFTAGLDRVLGVLDGEEADIFGQSEIDARNKRAEKRDAKSKAANAAPADSPRGDPAKGGAGGVDGKKPAKDAADKAVEPAVTKRKPGRPKGSGKGGDNVVPIGGKPPAADAAAVAAAEQQEGGEILDGHLATMEADALPEVPPDDGPAETGDQMITRIAAEKNAELEARGGMNGMAPIDASEPVDNGENSGNGLTGKTGFGSISDERPLSQSQQAAAVREKVGL